MFPPLPFESRLKRYRDALANRFDKNASGALAAAQKLLDSAEEHLESERQLPEATPGRATRIDAAQKLLTSARTVLADAKAHEILNPGLEGGADYVQRSLDLQISKAGGLLTFNGLVIAVGTLLWTTIDARSGSSSPAVVFWLMLVSSVITLLLIVVWWSAPQHYASATADISKSLRIGSIRGWTLNIATLMSIVSVCAVAHWIAKGTVKVTPPIVLEQPLSVTLSGTVPVQVVSTAPRALTLKCEWKQGPVSQKTAPLQGSLECRSTP